MLGIEDRAVIEELVNDEAKEPTPRKEEGSRSIYLSRNFGNFRKVPGRPKIADFGLAVKGKVSGLHNHPVQPDPFQAPELILRADAPTSEDSLPSLTGEDKRLFVEFGRKMLRWMPEDRATAGELLEHP
ncbi:hypothetical protein N7G274_006012 [Stereocaulon virgatum]|uniref:Protein kinase domain-containing protein n=1 Tax=Stereocaulon virgatum TaxID=373712 RepID=A0ABR4A5W4_9LECA